MIIIYLFILLWLHMMLYDPGMGLLLTLGMQILGLNK